jgi:hypothetical protein
MRAAPQSVSVEQAVPVPAVVQLPAEQVCPEAHTRPQAPQLFGSTFAFTQLAPQAIWLLPQVVDAP